ncbi:MAG: DHA2 family efflux MFS transporter permease subunit, partial [Halioglobus sp.]|nr:DHA2 family efflux MFS transporter permease subunit [Halioglobus sp.]
LASMLCGQASTLSEMIGWRIVQGVFGAAVVPLCQATLLDTFPKEKHATAMSLWGIGVMVGPVLGPTLGGWLTEYYNWRWVFYINAPIGILSIIGIYLYLPETEHRKVRFDALGFSLLALAVAALQLLVDRGEHVDWFDAIEIRLYLVAICAAICLFAVHVRTSSQRFLSPELLRDVNFVSGLIFIFVVGLVMLATMTLLPPFLQQWKGYPVATTGLILMPRGLGTIVSMMAVTYLVRVFDTRLLIVAGMCLTALALHQMSGFTLDVEQRALVSTGLIQGLGMGLITVPTSILAFATLAPHLRNEGAALYSLLRNLGSSIGVSIVMASLTRNLWINQQQLGERLQLPSGLLHELNPDNDLMAIPGAIVQEVSRQAAEIAYVNNFHLLTLVTLAAIPLVFLLSSPAEQRRAA